MARIPRQQILKKLHAQARRGEADQADRADRAEGEGVLPSRLGDAAGVLATLVARYVFVTPKIVAKTAAGLTSEGKQLCVDGLKHGERYNVNLRAGMPSGVKESRPLIAWRMPTRSSPRAR